MARLLLAALTLSLALTAPAQAGQLVYNGGDDIRVVNDDGSGDRVLIAREDVPGAETLYNPWVAPDGTTVMFNARTPAPGMGGLFCGFRCAGIYAYVDGQVFRISQPPTDCGGDQCTGLDIEPRLTADNRITYDLIYAEPNSSGTFNSISTPHVRSFDPGGSDEEIPAGPCGNMDGTPAPHPSDPAQYAGQTYCVRDGDASSWTLQLLDFQGNGTDLVFDDGAFSEISWRGDGQRLVAAEGGADPGIWTYAPIPGAADPRRVVAAEWDGDHSQHSTSPTFVGGDRLAFTWADTVRVVPASCDSCDAAGAQVLAQAAEEIDGLAWTSRTIPLPGDGGGDGDIEVGPLPKLKLGAALSKGIKVPFAAPAAGKLALKASVARKAAKKLKLRSRTVATGSRSVARAGGGKVKLIFAKQARKRLKKAGKVTLTVTGTFGGTRIAPFKLTLRR